MVEWKIQTPGLNLKLSANYFILLKNKKIQFLHKV